MDVLGSASTILQVADAAVGVYMALFGYFKSVKNAPERSRELRDEARLLSEALQILKLKVGDSPPSGTEVSAVKAMTDAISQLMSILKEMEGRINVSKKDIVGRLKWPFSEEENEKYLKKVQRYNVYFNTILESLEISKLQSIEHTSRRVERTVSDIHSISLDATRKEREETRLKILGWIFPGDVNSRHRTISGGRVQNSGRWLLESNTYKEWMEGKGADVFTCHAGVGKTVLASLVIDNIAESLTGQNVCVVHIYFDYKDPERQTADSIIRCLLKQLLIPLDLVPRNLQTLYEDQRRRLCLPDLATLIRLWDSLTSKYSSVYAVFDALDECKPKARAEILNLIDKLRRPNIKILCTFRSYVQSIVLEKFKGSHVQKIEAHAEDIRNYLSERLENEWLHHPAAIPIIIDKIASKATGQFLLVQYQLDNILSFAEPRNAVDALDSLPRELEGVYQGILDRIERGNKTTAIKILSWLYHTKRPMKMYELREAMAVQRGDRELVYLYVMRPDSIIQCCQGLVELDEDRGIVRFAHVTIQEFLEKTYIDKLHTPVELGKICLTYLNFDAFEYPCPNKEAFQERLGTYGFFDYAVAHSGGYIKGMGEEDPEILKLLTRLLKSPTRCAAFLQESVSLEPWLYRVKELVPPDELEGTTALHVLATLGLANFYKRCCDKTLDAEAQSVLEGVDIDAPGYGSTTALMCAAATGHKEMTAALVQNAANVNLQDDEGVTAVVHAAIRGYQDVVLVLMDNGADLNVTTEFGTPLEIVSLLGHKNLVHSLLERVKFESSPVIIVEALRMALSYECTEKAAKRALLDDDEETAYIFLTVFSSSGHREVEKMLLERCKDAEVVKANPGLLHLAIESEHRDIVVGLLAKDIDIEARNSNGRTPLHLAAALGNKEIVSILLQKGANVEVLDDEKMTPIHLAALGGNIEIISGLLEQNADIGAQDDQGWKPLHYAARAGNKEIVSLLLEHGADVNAETSKWQTPLHMASYSGHGDVLRTLLTKEARIEARENDRLTPLLVAAKMGQREIVLALLEAGADMSAQDKEGMNAIHHAASQKKDLVETLLDMGFDIESWDINGLTPLLHAAKAGSTENVLMLLKRNADWSTLDHDGRTALHYAASGGYLDVIKALLEAGIDINMRDQFGQSALAQAALRDQRDAVFLLLEEQAQVDINSDEDLHLLHMLASAGKNELLLRLLESKFEVNGRDEKGFTPLMKAAENGHEESIQTLLKHGADISMQDKEGMTALMHSIFEGHKIEALLERADLDVKDKDGYTVLHLAALKSQVKLVDLLLAKGAKVTAQSNENCTPLHIAAVKGSLDIVKLLLEHGANPHLMDEDGWTPLHFAASSGHGSTVTELWNADNETIEAADNSGRKPLHLAAGGGHKSVIRLLLSRGTDLGCRDDRGWSALHFAASHGQRLTVIELIQQGLDVNFPDLLESTPLHKAAIDGQINSARELLARKANVNATDANGNTPLHEAALHGKIEMVAYLIDHKADVKMKSTLGSTILHAAVLGEELAVVSLVLRSDLDIDAQDSDGMTALHLATSGGSHEILIVLLDAGANVNATNHSGRTPLHLAAAGGDITSLSILIERGAKLEMKSNEGFRALTYAFLAYDVEATFFLFQRMIQRSNLVDTELNNPEHHPTHASTGDSNGDDMQKQNRDKSDIDILNPLNIDPTTVPWDPIQMHMVYRKYTERLGCEIWNDGFPFGAFSIFDNVVDSDPFNQSVRTVAEVVHTNCLCTSCRREIKGFRCRCIACDDFEFCEQCYGEGKGQNHSLVARHDFIRIPSELWWPED